MHQKSSLFPRCERLNWKNWSTVLKRRRGSSAVEFALVAPTMFLMVLGIIELGRGLMVAQLLTHAAREGCRQAVTGNYTSAQIQTNVTNALTGLGIGGGSVSVAVNDNTGTALTSATPSGSEITVSASVPVGQVTWVPGGVFLKNNLTGEFTMRKE